MPACRMASRCGRLNWVGEGKIYLETKNHKISCGKWRSFCAKIYSLLCFCWTSLLTKLFCHKSKPSPRIPVDCQSWFDRPHFPYTIEWSFWFSVWYRISLVSVSPARETRSHSEGLRLVNAYWRLLKGLGASHRAWLVRASNTQFSCIGLRFAQQSAKIKDLETQVYRFEDLMKMMM